MSCIYTAWLVRLYAQSFAENFRYQLFEIAPSARKYLQCTRKPHRSKLYIACSDFFTKIRVRSCRCSSFSEKGHGKSLGSFVNAFAVAWLPTNLFRVCAFGASASKTVRLFQLNSPYGELNLRCKLNVLRTLLANLIQLKTAGFKFRIFGRKYFVLLRQCKIQHKPDIYIVHDLQSKNPVFQTGFLLCIIHYLIFIFQY